MKKDYTPKYSTEFGERGVRLYQENRSNYPSDNAAFLAIGAKLGFSPDSLRSWCHQAERNAGERVGLTSDEKRRLKESERENCELRAVNEILRVQPKSNRMISVACCLKIRRINNSVD